MAKIKFGFYLEEEEKKDLIKKAEAEKRSMANYVRNKIFGKNNK